MNLPKTLLIPGGHGKAFTLLELLVIVAIIGVLAALLSATLGRAKARIQETVCINNLRQIGHGIMLYRDDNRDCFPLRVSEKGSFGTPPREQSDTGFNQNLRFFDNALGGENPLDPNFPRKFERPLFGYVGSARTFHCPADRGAEDGWNNVLIRPSLWKQHGCSYSYNARAAKPGEPLGLEGIAGKPGSWVPNPSTFILVYERPARWVTSRSSVVLWHRAMTSKSMLLEEHLGNGQRLVAPFLFVDGHVRVFDLSRDIQENRFARNTDQLVWNKLSE